MGAGVGGGWVGLGVLVGGGGCVFVGSGGGLVFVGGGGGGCVLVGFGFPPPLLVAVAVGRGRVASGAGVLVAGSDLIPSVGVRVMISGSEMVGVWEGSSGLNNLVPSIHRPGPVRPLL